ncbi:MAG: glycosyltransferase, partial [Proteobacteria bacterium]|nr:glycosyltransferase [Pseudomonadota bacterium]MBU1585899.1 glycosyltransferase [Pseudomonadota bacterium]
IEFIYSVLIIILKKRPQRLFISLPKEFFGFFRTSTIIMISSLLRIKVYGDLAGAFFTFLGRKNSLKYYFGKYILKKVTSIRLLGPSIKEVFEGIGIRNTVYFSNGVYKPLNRTIKKEVIYNNVLNLLYVGALNYSKGIEKIIYSVDQCLKNNLSIKLYCIGEWSDEKERKEIESLINNLGIEEHITFHGLLIDKAKWDIFSNCGLLLHPTNWDGQPLTILEAMGLGLGIISTKVGAIHDTVIHERNGIILKRNDSRNLTEAINLFYLNRDYLASVSKNNIEDFNNKYTTDIFLNNFFNWLEDTPLNKGIL